jgi:hypothetical protein
VPAGTHTSARSKNGPVTEPKTLTIRVDKNTAVVEIQKSNSQICIYCRGTRGCFFLHLPCKYMTVSSIVSALIGNSKSADVGKENALLSDLLPVGHVQQSLVAITIATRYILCAVLAVK